MSDLRRGRVTESHAIARHALRPAAAFAMVAVVWGVVVVFTGGGWWGPLHAFLAGTVVLAISAFSQMFTVTWAAARPPSRALVAFQRWAVTGGTAVVLTGVAAAIPTLVWLGAGSMVAGLVALAISIIGAVRRSLLRRFDLSARYYLVAFAAGAAGVTLGALMGSGAAGDAYAAVRSVHVHLNLLGLIGLTIVGTLPTFLPTVAHHRVVSGFEAVLGWWVGVGGVVAIALGLIAPVWTGVGTLLVAASAAVVTGAIVARLGAKGRRRPPFVQITAGMAWLVAWAVVDGVSIVAGQVTSGRWVAAVVVAGIGQVLAGSLAYLLPVLAGPPLAPTTAWINRHSWLSLALANLAGAALVIGWTAPGIAVAGAWMVDLLRRLAGASLSRRAESAAQRPRRTQQ